MRALWRLAAIAVVGAALDFAGIVNGIILEHPDRGEVGVVVVAVAAAIVLIIFALMGTGRGDAATRRRGDGGHSPLARSRNVGLRVPAFSPTGRFRFFLRSCTRSPRRPPASSVS